MRCRSQCQVAQSPVTSFPTLAGTRRAGRGTFPTTQKARSLVIMRQLFRLLLVVAAAGCGGDATDPEFREVTVTGVLLDSLANRPLANQWLIVGTDTVSTDVNGGFIASMQPGAVHVRFGNYPFYDSVSITLNVQRDTSLTIQPKRLLPFMKDFVVTDTTFEATIIA